LCDACTRDDWLRWVMTPSTIRKRPSRRQSRSPGNERECPIREDRGMVGRRSVFCRKLPRSIARRLSWGGRAVGICGVVRDRERNHRVVQARWEASSTPHFRKRLRQYDSQREQIRLTGNSTESENHGSPAGTSSSETREPIRGLTPPG